MKTLIKTLALALTASVWTLQQASASVVGVDLGTANPPTTLGGYMVSPYDPGSIGGADYYEYEVAGTGEGALHPGEGEWATWGQSYTGNVYVTIGSPTLTLTLSGGVEAVYFYEEPNQFSDFTMTATDSSGTQVTTIINGDHGSSGVGFYETVAGDYLTSISVVCSDPTGFAIGEFGISGGQLTGTSAPETGFTLGFMAIGLCGLLAYSRFGRVVKA